VAPPQAPSQFVAGKELTEELERHSTPVPCPHQRVLFRQGDEPTGVYILLKGRAKLTLQSASGEVVLRLDAGRGSVLGLPGVIANKPYSLTAIADRGAQVGFITCDDFKALMSKQEMFSLKVLEMLANQVHATRHAIFDS
jgi:CRP/FNR family transcriptional regulator, dissimilatory nitrate respiration regulator